MAFCRSKHRSKIHQQSIKNRSKKVIQQVLDFLIDLGPQLGLKIPLGPATWSPRGTTWDATWAQLATNGANLTAEINRFEKKYKKIEYRNGYRFFSDGNRNLGGGLAAGADPL